MTTIDATILALGAVVLLVLLARRLLVPHPTMLVLGGLAVAMIPGAPLLAIEPSAALAIFLPPVLFQESSRISWREARANALAIGLVAPTLVVGTTIAVAWVATQLFPGIPPAVAIVIGTVVAPADSSASKAVLARLHVPRRAIATLVGEGLVNDAIAVVIYKLAVATALGAFLSAGEAVRAFAILVPGGLAFGTAAGWIGARLLRASGEPAIHSLTSLAVAFLTYLGADAIGASGALATVAAGVMCSLDERRIPVETRFNVAIFWQLVTFALNATGFLLIGVQLPRVMDDLGFYSTGELAGYAAAICGTILAARLAVVVGIGGADRLVRQLRGMTYHSWREDVVSGWSGMRGLVTLAAALGLPLTPEGSVFPYRDLTLFLAFAAILSTLIGQGLTLAPIVRLLGVGDDRSVPARRSARIAATEAALAELDRMAGAVPTTALEPIRAEYRLRLARLRPDRETGGDAAEIPSGVRAQAIAAERQALNNLARAHAIDDDLLHELLAELELAEVAALRREGS